MNSSLFPFKENKNDTNPGELQVLESAYDVSFTFYCKYTWKNRSKSLSLSIAVRLCEKAAGKRRHLMARGQIIRPATLPATSAFPETASHYLSEGLSDSHFVAGNPGHATTQGAAFYAQDFVSYISVCIVSGHRHGTKHGLSYTKPGNTEHVYKHKPRYN
jgi:hypothetical protein